MIGDKTKKMECFLAKMHNNSCDFLDDKMHEVIFLDDIPLVEKRVFLWYDTENRFRTGKSENRTTIFVSLK